MNDAEQRVLGYYDEHTHHSIDFGVPAYQKIRVPSEAMEDAV